VVAAIVPEYPALQVHPCGSHAPSEFSGQPTAEQLPVKYGSEVLAAIVPEYPALQMHPCGTDTPVEFSGQATAEQLPPEYPARHDEQLPVK